MAVQVVFFLPAGIGPTDDAPGVGLVRLREEVTLPGVTDGAARAGEIVVVYNGEDGPVLVAHGPDPDAAATVETANTTAGYPVPSAQNSAPFIPNTGSTISVKALA